MLESLARLFNILGFIERFTVWNSVCGIYKWDGNVYNFLRYDFLSKEHIKYVQVGKSEI